MGYSKVMGWLVAMATLSACTMEMGEATDVAQNDDGETLGSVSQAVVDNTFAVGVIPVAFAQGRSESGMFGTTCPADSELVQFHMDDEDDETQTDWFGFFSDDSGRPWGLPQTSRRSIRPGLSGFNTTFRFCKVNGQSFRPRTTDVNDKGNFYAVLKLGQFCPNGSLEFSRHIDNEDDDPGNWFTGPIAPNVSDANTTFRFCFFRTGSAGSLMTKYPGIGINYAVFHDWDGDQPGIIAKHWRYTDDEDNRNENSTSPSGTSAATDFGAIISSGPNTLWEFGQVR